MKKCALSFIFFCKTYCDKFISHISYNYQSLHLRQLTKNMLNQIFICQANMYIKQKSVIRNLKNFPMNDVKPAAKLNIANKNRSFFVLYKFINFEIQFTSSFMTLPNAISRVELKGKMIGGRVQQFDNYLTSCFRIYFLLANLSVCLFVYWFVRIYFFKKTCLFVYCS